MQRETQEKSVPVYFLVQTKQKQNYRSLVYILFCFKQVLKISENLMKLTYVPVTYTPATGHFRIG